MHSRASELLSYLHLDLYAAGWDGLENHYPGRSTSQFAMTALSKSLLKKFHNDQTDKSRDDKALALFLECNERCKNYSGVLPVNLLQELILNEAKSYIYDFFNPPFVGQSVLRGVGRQIPVTYRAAYRKNGNELIRCRNSWIGKCVRAHDYLLLLGFRSRDPVGSRFVVQPCKREDNNSLYREPLLLNLSDISNHFGLGNGSNRGSRSTDFYTKFVNSCFQHTNEVLPILYRQAISSFKLESTVDAFRQEHFGSEMVCGSRLAFAPKNADISRVTCTEPILNMLFQKGVSGVVEARLREVYGIDLSTQPDKNRELARIGSLTDRFCTIDLKSASDLISLRMIGEMFPKEPVNWLLRCRSPKTVLPDGSEVELYMLSSMGNGFTFSIMTTLFCCLVAATYKVLGIKTQRPFRNNLGNFAVFGDDLIVEKRAYGPLCDCLEALGLVVNRDKSFFEGPFRESCGADYISGVDVRGVYLKRLLDDRDTYSAINRLNRWSTKHGIFLTRTVGSLRNGCRFLGVPYDEADDAGIKIPSSLLRVPRRDRNGAISYLALCSVPLRIRVPAVGVGDEVIPDAAYQVKRTSDGLWYCPAPKRMHHGGRAIPISRAHPWFRYSADGVLLCLVAGWIGGGTLVVRSETRLRAVLRKRVCPGWDTSAFRSGVAHKTTPDGYEEWKFFVAGNLVNSPLN